MKPAILCTRKYALRRVKAGDYLLLSNDGATLWRLARYAEDGSATVNDRPLLGHFWGVWKWMYPVAAKRPLNVDDWNDFECYDSVLPSLRAAIVVALKRGAPKPFKGGESPID